MLLDTSTPLRKPSNLPEAPPVEAPPPYSPPPHRRPRGNSYTYHITTGDSVTTTSNPFIDVGSNQLRSARRKSCLKVLLVPTVVVFGFLWYSSRSNTSPVTLLSWGSLQKGPCFRYNTRQYSAPLVFEGHPVAGMNKECEVLEMEIHGKLARPTQCQHQGAMNETWGIWTVDFDEPSCSTWWSPPKDSGCTAKGSGYRRFEARLENVERGASWEDMCQSTPVTFNNHSFTNPDHCNNRGILGMYGAWNVADNDC